MPLPQTAQAVNDVMDTTLATTSYASRASLHHMLNISPGALVFHRDMLLNIPLLADLALIHNHHQVLINENLWQQNLKHCQFDYQVGQKVLLLNSKLKPDKLEPQATEGPYYSNSYKWDHHYTTRRIRHRANQHSLCSPLSWTPMRFYALLAFLVLFLSMFFPWEIFYALRHGVEECSISGLMPLPAQHKYR